MKKITIAIACNRTVKAKTMQCLLEMITHGGFDFHIVIAEHGYTIAENRTICAVRAIRNKSDFLLFIDDDMIFPANTCERLVSLDKDIVGPPYRGRTINSKRIVTLLNGNKVNLDEPHGKEFDEPFEVQAKGTGVMLVKTEVFKMDRPWFDFEFSDLGACTMGEDYFFCRKAREKGFKIWCDPTLSIKHIGDYLYGSI